MQSNELRMHMFCLEYCAAIISHLWRHDFTLWQHSFVVAPCRAASMESRFYQACREPALQSSRQAAKQSDRTLRAERHVCLEVLPIFLAVRSTYDLSEAGVDRCGGQQWRSIRGGGCVWKLC